MESRSRISGPGLGVASDRAARAWGGFGCANGASVSLAKSTGGDTSATAWRGEVKSRPARKEIFQAVIIQTLLQLFEDLFMLPLHLPRTPSSVDAASYWNRLVARMLPSKNRCVNRWGLAGPESSSARAGCVLRSGRCGYTRAAGCDSAYPSKSVTIAPAPIVLKLLCSRFPMVNVLPPRSATILDRHPLAWAAAYQWLSHQLSHRRSGHGHLSRSQRPPHGDHSCAAGAERVRGWDIYVETENSVYRLRFRSAPAVEAAASSTVKSG